jgi:hypothetical protein
MATLIKNSNPAAYSISTYQSKGSSTTSRNTAEFLFFSDCPETLTTAHLADQGKWLNKATVSGTGQIYHWHLNSTGSSIYTCLGIYNQNNFTIKVNVPNYGTTLGTAGSVPSDSAAWQSYFQGQSTSVTVAAGAYGNLFLKSVPNNCVYGVVAKASITNNSTGASASAVFYDLAYTSNSGNATAFAAAQSGGFQRGHGDGFYQTINFAAIAYGSETNKKGYKIGSTGDVFSGSDLSNITDDSGSTSGPLNGAYGQIFVVNLPITNNTSASRAFRVFIGSNGGQSFPFVYMNGDLAVYGSTDPYYGRDVIQTGLIGANSTATVSFSTVVPASSSTPYVIGVYPI